MSSSKIIKIIVVLMLALTNAAVAQHISGATKVCKGRTYTYTSSGITGYVVWSIQGGTFVGGRVGTQVSVVWSSGGRISAASMTEPPDFEADASALAAPPPSGGATLPIYTMAGGTTSIGPSSSLTGEQSDESLKPVEGSGALSAMTVPTGCGSYSGMVTLTGSFGPIMRWEKSYDQVNWEPISHTASTYQFTATQTTWFRAVVGDVYCQLYSSNAPVYVIQPPVASVASSVQACKGKVVTLQATFPEADGFRWYDSPSGGNPIAYTADFTTVVLYTQNTYWVSAIKVCEGPRVPVTVTAHPDAIPPAQPGVVKECGYTTLNYWPMGGPYYWQSSPAGFDTTRQESNFTVQQDGLYYVKRKDPNTGCWSTATTINVAVNEIPPAPALADIVEYRYCRWTLIGVLPGPPESPIIGYYWQSTPLGTDTKWSSSREVTAPGTYYARGISNEGCWSTTSTAYTVTSLANPVSCLGTQNMNYIVTNTIQKEGVKAETDVPMLEVKDNTQTIAYADGFGRTIQRVTPQGTPAKKDLVQLHAYDRFGRENRKYLPYAAATDDGKFKADASSAQLSFFSPADAQADRHAATTTPWAETVFEASQLNRVTEQGAPGEAWQPGNATVKNKFLTNDANQVRSWRCDLTTGQCSSSGFYPAGELTVEETADENGAKTWIFKDRQGRTVLVKSETTSSIHALTYYVYDAFSRLRMVIQPEGVKMLLPMSGTLAPDADFISKWCFTYDYDRYGRVIKKKSPAAESVHLVYNKRDQVILSQDGNQRSRNEWTFTRYDALKRPVMSGIYTHPSALSQEQMQQAADAHAGQFEIRTAANYAVQHGYTINASFPVLNAGNSRIHTVHYFDDYNFDNDPATAEPRFTTTGQLLDPVPDYRVTGKITGVKVAVPSTGQMLLAINFYDKKGNIIQQQQENHLGGKDIVTDLYDFAGLLLFSRRTHQAQGKTLTVNKFYDYDHAGRLTSLRQQVNSAAPVTVATYTYNALGQQVEKKLHSTDGTNYLQKVDYGYNIRGWLSRINDTSLSEPSDLFGMELVYNEPPKLSAATRQYNGNVAELITKDGVQNRFSGYALEYDRLGRMHTATYIGYPSTGSYSENGITYDLNGNILSLKRNSGNATKSYYYSYSGNSLHSLDNIAPGSNGPAEFAYDANGNMIANSNKGIEFVAYNHLNLTDAVVTDKGEINYTYDAAGTRLSKTVIDSTGATTTRHYVKGIEYNENGQIEHFPTEEGRVVMKGSTPEYQYYLKDHLGNIRITFTSAPETSTATATLEKMNAKQEQGQFLNMDEAVKIDYALFDHTQVGTSRCATRLNATAQERIGLARSLSVMTGDVIRMQVFAKYLDPEQANWTAALNNFMTAVAAGTAPAGTLVDGGAAGSISEGTFPFAGLMDKSSSTGTGPKAYLNYIVFDRSFRYRDAGFVRLSSAAKENGSGVPHEKLFKELTITEPGYMYIYLSNENDTPVEVYFDDFSVTNVNSLAVSSNEYYPFGMTFNSCSRENSMDQHYLFNGKERQTELGLNWDDFGARMYDPEIARWNVMDPMAGKAPSWTPFRFGFNNPLRYTDPDGNFEMSSEVSRYGISRTIESLPAIFQNKSPEFKAIFKKYSGLDEKQTLAILEPGKGPGIASSVEASWSRGQGAYADFAGIPGSYDEPSIVLSARNVLSEKGLTSKDLAANRLFYEAILFAQAVKYGILRKWSNGPISNFRKTGDPIQDAVLTTYWQAAMSAYRQEQEEAEDAFLNEAYGITSKDETGKRISDDKKRALEEIKNSQAQGSHPGTQPNLPEKEKKP